MGRRSKSLNRSAESHVEDEVFENFTPEGKDLVRRVLASTDLTITVQETRHALPFEAEKKQIADKFDREVARRKKEMRPSMVTITIGLTLLVLAVLTLVRMLAT